MILYPTIEILTGQPFPIPGGEGEGRFITAGRAHDITHIGQFGGNIAHDLPVLFFDCFTQMDIGAHRCAVAGLGAGPVDFVGCLGHLF